MQRHITLNDRVVRHAVKKSRGLISQISLLLQAAIPPRVWAVRWMGFINVIEEPTESYKRYLSDKASKDSIQICTANAHFKKGNIFAHILTSVFTLTCGLYSHLYTSVYPTAYMLRSYL